MTTKIPVELSSTPGIVDGSNATAITIDSSENVTVTGLTTTEGVVSTRTGDASQFVRRGGSITTGFGDSLYILHSTTGDMAEDFGVGMTFAVKDSGATQSLGDLGYTRRGADNTADFILQTYNGGTRAEKFRVLAGGGICFNGDKVAANALDDYEEGTWNPSFIGTAGSAGSWAESSWTARYTKIGRVVRFHASGYVTNKGSYSGNSRVAGLPYTNAGSTNACTVSLFPDSDYPNTKGIVAQVAASSSEVHFFTGARADVAHAWADVGTGYYCNISGHYEVS